MKDTIIIHCSATRAGQNITAADIDCWHRARGFWSIGYHYVIRLDGTIEPGRDVTLDGAFSSRKRLDTMISRVSSPWTGCRNALRLLIMCSFLNCRVGRAVR